MTRTTPPRPRLRLTRRGRLVRSILVLLLVVVLLVTVISLLRGGRADGSAAASDAPTTAAPAYPAAGSASDAGGASPTSAEGTDPAAEQSTSTPEAEGGDAGDDEQIHRSGDEGDGTWTVATPVRTDPPTDGTVRTYALRVENGIDVDPEKAAAEIAGVLADERGWQGLSDVVFQQVAEPAEAEFTISIASPPTVDELCLPARTGGLWSCRIGSDVALNSDRWLYMTPTYDDLAEYRAYMINHEVGHFLGHKHAECGGEGEAAPVMLQQSIDLQGCVPNAWPTTEA